jgi:G:T-mismatch repair DNA endonuclease (very short patch repair protein)
MAKSIKKPNALGKARKTRAKKADSVKRKPARGRAAVPASVLRKARARRPPSSLELKVYAMLDELGILFVKEKAISQCTVDIFIESRTIIELQGCFWHGCLSCSKSLTADQKKWQILDGRRHHVLRGLGYDVMLIWEHEVEKEPERVQRVLKALAPVKGVA